MSTRNGIKNRFEDYLTDIDVSSPWEKLPPEYQEHLDKWWAEIDSDQEYQKRTRGRHQPVLTAVKHEPGGEHGL